MTLGDKAEQVFRGRYAFNDTENWEGLSRRVGTGLAIVEPESQQWGEKFSEVIYNMLFLPAGRILRNTGRPRGTLLNCFSLGIEDSIRSIAYQCAKAMILWSEGGGVGFNFSNLRPEDAPIIQKGGVSSGPVSFLTHYDGGAQTIKTGGDRRAAALGLMVVSHPDIFKFIGAKRQDGLLSNFNLSVGITEEFLDAVEQDKDWDLRFNHKLYNTIKARALWNLMMEYMVQHGDPGLINWDNLRSNNSYYFAEIESTNPCFSKNTKISTKQGHFEIRDLVGKEVDIWDGDDWVNINNFRITGEHQKMLKVTLYDGSELRVTPYHTFYLEDGKPCEARELKEGDRLALSNAPLVHGNIEEKGAYIKGFLLGDGTIVKGDHPRLKLYEPKYCCEGNLIESSNQLEIENINTNALKELKFKYEEINNRKNLTGLTVRKQQLHKWCHEYKNKLPKEIFQWDLKSKCEFLAGYFDADGSILDTKNGYGYQVWSNSKHMLIDIQLLLKTIGVQSKLSFGKAACKKDFNDGYGEYSCKESYRITISQKYSIKLSKMVKFDRLKDFSNRETKNLIADRFNKVISIEEDGVDEKVYCCTVPKSHKVSLSLGILTGQCGEAPLSNGESCDLGSLVLPNFITGTKNTNWELMRETIFTSVRMLDNVLNCNRYALDENKDQSMAGRRIGIGIMGLAEYLFAKKLRYGSESAISSIEYLMRKIRNYCYEASIKLAEEKGSFPKFDPVMYMKAHFIKTLPAQIRTDIKKYGIRNVTTMAIAPTGTISLIPEVTGSGEPLTYKAYMRNDRIGSRPYIHPIYKDILLNGGETPDWFVDSTDLKPTEHLETQSIMQKYTDGAISKTINVPNNTTSEELSVLLLEYMRDLKGVTVYRDGSKEGQILVPISKEDAKKAVLADKIDVNPDVETTKCSSGSCEV